MNLIEHLEAALCGTIRARRLASGLVAVGTDFLLSDGDKLGFFVREAPEGLYVHDDGSTLPLLDAQGVSLESPTRAQVLAALLDEYGFSQDPETLDLLAGPFAPEELPGAAVRMISLILRLQDFLLLHPQVVATTFREDLRRSIQNRFAGIAEVAFDTTLAPAVDDIAVDALIRCGAAEPVAVLFGTSEIRLTEAALLRLEAQVANVSVRVVAMIERMRPESVSQRVLSRAMNKLDRVLVFRDDEANALNALADLARVDDGARSAAH